MPGDTPTAAAIVGSLTNPHVALAHPEAATPAVDPAAPAAVDPAAPAAAEPAVVPPKEGEAKPDDKFAAKFAALQRRERAAVAKESEVKTRETKLAEREAKVDAWKKSPMQFLTDNDLTVEQFLDSIAEGKEVATDPVKKAEKLINDWKVEQEKEKSDRATREQEKQLQDARAAATEKIKAAGDAYELVNTTGNHALVFEVIQEYFEANKDKVQNMGDAILTLEKAAEMVESYLERDFEARFAKSKKIAAKFSKPAPAAAPAEPTGDPDPDADDGEDPKPETPAKPEQQPQTLTNNMGSNGTDPDAGRQLTREESLARAAKLIRFN